VANEIPGQGVAGYFIGDQSDLTPDKLHELAADAIATAEWIEATGAGPMNA
jgi:hypothetical protein